MRKSLIDSQRYTDWNSTLAPNRHDYCYIHRFASGLRWMRTHSLVAPILSSRQMAADAKYILFRAALKIYQPANLDITLEISEHILSRQRGEQEISASDRGSREFCVETLDTGGLAQHGVGQRWTVDMASTIASQRVGKHLRENQKVPML